MTGVQTCALPICISGVSHDEKRIDLIQYNKAYSAAARVMTTLDEALDTIINKMGIVGR